MKIKRGEEGERVREGGGGEETKINDFTRETRI